MTTVISKSGWATLGFPAASPALEKLGLKFSSGGSHISRTMMLAELESVLVSVPSRSSASDYRDAVLARNVLAKTTESTRQKSLRHLRELYALDEAVPIFALLRKLNALYPASLSLLAVQVAWARDPLFRATTAPILDSTEGARVETVSLAQAVEAVFPNQYSEVSQNAVARHAASSWTQSGHLVGRANKIRSRVKPSPVAVTLAVVLGNAAGNAEPLAGSTTTVPGDAPIGHLQPRAQQFSPRSPAVQTEQQQQSIFDAEQQKLDKQLDKSLNICRC